MSVVNPVRSLIPLFSFNVNNGLNGINKLNIYVSA
jgi:hypothetical protein